MALGNPGLRPGLSSAVPSGLHFVMVVLTQTPKSSSAQPVVARLKLSAVPFVRTLNFREISFLSLRHAGRDQVERAVRGKGRTFLPTDDVAGMIARQVDATLGLGPYLITWGRAGVGAADPGT